MIRDMDIRRALWGEMKRLHEGDKDTLIVEEVGLCQGEARIDLAVVNGSFHGYEIKSERDTLARLPSQTRAYGRALEYVTIVVSPFHANKVVEIVPSWWGVQRAVLDRHHLRLETIRKPAANPHLEAFSVAQFLWRDEALQVLIDHGLEKGMRSKSREELWRRLASAFTLEELGSIIRGRLKSRGENWRSPALRA